MDSELCFTVDFLHLCTDKVSHFSGFSDVQLSASLVTRFCFKYTGARSRGCYFCSECQFAVEGLPTHILLTGSLTSAVSNEYGNDKWLKVFYTLHIHRAFQPGESSDVRLGGNSTEVCPHTFH